MPSLRASVIAALASCASFVTPAPLLAQDPVIDITPESPFTSLLFDVDNRGQAVGRAELGNDNVRAIVWENGRVTDLGALPDYPQSGAAAINERGWIVGYVANFDAARAALWDAGRIIDLTPPGWYSCVASDINNRGDIVGSCAATRGGLSVAVLWRGGLTTTLGVLPGYLASSASAINEAGIVVGTLTNHLEDRSTAFRWADGTMAGLPLPPNAANTFATAINARGTIAGTATGPIGASPEPVIWQGDSVAPLGGTWGAVIGDARGINDRDEVVGTSFGPIGGFVWSAGTFTSLDSPFGSFPQEINERGIAVGFIFTEGGPPLHGAVWPLRGLR